MPLRAWWANRRTADKYTKGYRGWDPSWTFDYRRPWHRCIIGRGGNCNGECIMEDFTPNIPEVVEEVHTLFERYEKALIDKDVDILDNTFWNSPYTIRYAMAEHGYGFDEIHQHRL